MAKVLKDVGSGRDDKRPGYQDLLADVVRGDIDVVVVCRLDRLSRNVRDVYSFLEQAREAGIGFASTSENFDTTTAMGRAMLGVAAVLAQLTREMIGENVRDGLAKRARSGKHNGPKGRQSPMGYDYDPKKGQLVANKAEAKIVRRIFETGRTPAIPAPRRPAPTCVGRASACVGGRICARNALPHPWVG